MCEYMCVCGGGGEGGGRVEVEAAGSGYCAYTPEGTLTSFREPGNYYVEQTRALCVHH